MGNQGGIPISWNILVATVIMAIVVDRIKLEC